MERSQCLPPPLRLPLLLRQDFSVKGLVASAQVAVGVSLNGWLALFLPMSMVRPASRRTEMVGDKRRQRKEAFLRYKEGGKKRERARISIVVPEVHGAREEEEEEEEGAKEEGICLP